LLFTQGDANVYKHSLLSLIVVLFVVGAASGVQADQVYVESSNKNFGLLDLQTGAYTLIGVTSQVIGGIGFATNGSLYGLGADSVLYNINPTTAALTPIGNTGLNLTGGWGMGTTQDGTLYALSQENKLYTVNPSTADVTFIGNLGFNSTCCPYGDAAGNLYDGQGGFGSGFYKIDRTNGLGTLLGNASYGGVDSLVFSNNTMYALNGTGSIYAMNLDNGTSTLVSTFDTSIVGSPYAAAAQIAAAPEASPLTIGLLAGLMVGRGWLRRRRPQW
jgi:hypothetical protein